MPYSFAEIRSGLDLDHIELVARRAAIELVYAVNPCVIAVLNPGDTTTYTISMVATDGSAVCREHPFPGGMVETGPGWYLVTITAGGRLYPWEMGSAHNPGYVAGHYCGVDDIHTAVVLSEWFKAISVAYAAEKANDMLNAASSEF